MRVLDLGAGLAHNAADLWPDAKVVRVDVDPDVEPDVVADVRSLPADIGEFDAILASHILEHLRRQEIIPTVDHWAGFLAPGGMLHVLVPDIMWAAERILAGGFSSAVMAHVYGSQQNEWQHHKMGFTVGLLRAVVRTAGLVIREARVGPYEIEFNGDKGESERVVARQIYVVGQRPEED